MIKKYFSFCKFSLIRGKKYKNEFVRKMVEIFSDGKEEYLVDKEGSVYKRFGTTSKVKLKEKFGERIRFKKLLSKHIYIICLGNKKEKRDWYNEFLPKPYPKLHKEKPNA